MVLYTRKIEGKTIRIFASYATSDEEHAKIIKKFLEGFSLSVFLAHEDIRAATPDWQNELVHNLKGCDVFMPTYNKGFSSSEWTNQEIGFCICP